MYKVELKVALNKGDPFEAYEKQLEKVLSADSAIAAAYAQHNQRVDEILLEARRDAENIPSSTVFSITRQIENPYLERPDPVFSQMAENVRTRMNAAGGVGVTASAAIAGLVVQKLLAKGVVKAAATSVVKLVSSKVATGGLGTTIGGVLGGVIGSIVPFAGTAAGAAAGGAIGAVVFGVSAEALMLKIDEMFNREDFKAEIVELIEIERESMINMIRDVESNSLDLPRSPADTLRGLGIIGCGFSSRLIESEGR